jgi:hypothetical protein
MHHALFQSNAWSLLPQQKNSRPSRGGAKALRIADDEFTAVTEVSTSKSCASRNRLDATATPLVMNQVIQQAMAQRDTSKDCNLDGHER